AAALLLTLVACERGASTSKDVQKDTYEMRMPGPAPQARGFDAAARNDECEQCHDAIAAEWRASLHRVAYTDWAFQRAFEKEPLAFCRGCHAPEAAPARAPAAPLAALGVGCVTCHLPGEAVLAAPRSGPEAAVHPVTRAPAFATAAACARCHEFEFPRSGHRVAAFMQTTAREHAASPARDRSCADCHMPRVADDAGGHRSHRFEATRSAEILKGALAIAAARPRGDRVEVTLEARDVGHAVPTGDLNRRLSVWARVLDPARRRERQIAYLARHFESVHAPGQPPLRAEVADDRVFPGELRVVTFDLKPEDAGLPVAWGVSHERVETFLSEQDPRSAIIAGAVELAEGVLQPGQATSAAAPGS
ncbi:MAG: hypothetical protein KC636_28185, partial [Myxococcales bacterium]|nr:hypothetical protein [Myxococcales bacterium]